MALKSAAGKMEATGFEITYTTGWNLSKVDTSLVYHPSLQKSGQIANVTKDRQDYAVMTKAKKCLSSRSGTIG